MSGADVTLGDVNAQDVCNNVATDVIVIRDLIMSYSMMLFLYSMSGGQAISLCASASLLPNDSTE